MAAGDVAVQLVEVGDGSDVDTALTAMRATAGANGKYGVCSLNTVPAQVLIWAITEA